MTKPKETIIIMIMSKSLPVKTVSQVVAITTENHFVWDIYRVLTTLLNSAVGNPQHTLYTNAASSHTYIITYNN